MKYRAATHSILQHPSLWGGELGKKILGWNKNSFNKWSKINFNINDNKNNAANDDNEINPKKTSGAQYSCSPPTDQMPCPFLSMIFYDIEYPIDQLGSSVPAILPLNSLTDRARERQ